jgi:hypothetical protein
VLLVVLKKESIREVNRILVAQQAL